MKMSIMLLFLFLVFGCGSGSSDTNIDFDTWRKISGIWGLSKDPQVTTPMNGFSWGMSEVNHSMIGFDEIDGKLKFWNFGLGLKASFTVKSFKQTTANTFSGIMVYDIDKWGNQMTFTIYIRNQKELDLKIDFYGGIVNKYFRLTK